MVASFTIRYLERNINPTKAVRAESAYPIVAQSLTMGQAVPYKEQEDSFSDLNKEASILEKYAEKLLKKLSPKVHTLSG